MGVTHTKIIDVMRDMDRKEKNKIFYKRRGKIWKVCLNCGRKFYVWAGLRRARAKLCTCCSALKR